MERVKVAVVRNPFDPLNSREIRELEPGVTVYQAVRELEPTAEADFTAAVNGRVIDVDEWGSTPLSPGDSLSFAATPRGGGGGGKDPLRTVAMLAVVVAAPMAAAALVPATLAGSASEIVTDAGSSTARCSDPSLETTASAAPETSIWMSAPSGTMNGGIDSLAAIDVTTKPLTSFRT